MNTYDDYTNDDAIDLQNEIKELMIELWLQKDANKVLGKALLIACNGDTNKAVKCIDETRNA